MSKPRTQKDRPMSLYPPGHQAFMLRGIVAEELTAENIQLIAHEGDLQYCLNAAYGDLVVSRHHLEQLRARLFRAERLIETQPLPAKALFVLLPHDMAALLESLKATEKCLQEWLESETCQRILEKYPQRRRTTRRTTP